MTELDQFTHETFVASGAPVNHAIPPGEHHTHQLHLPHNHEAVRGTIEVVRDAAVTLLKDTLRDSLIAVSAVGTVLGHLGPAACLPIVLVIVVCVQFTLRKVE
jgi:hypothetical protein